MKNYIRYEKSRNTISVEDFLDLIDIPITIGLTNRGNFYASLRGAETKKDSSDKFLTSTTGFGVSREDACSDLLENLQGKLLVVNAMGEKDRKEFPVPYFTNIASFVISQVKE